MFKMRSSRKRGWEKLEPKEGRRGSGFSHGPERRGLAVFFFKIRA